MSTIMNDKTNAIVKIFDTEIVTKAYGGKMVVTFKDIDKCHNRPDGTAGRNFRKNREHFRKGEDFFSITPTNFQSDDIRRFGITSPKGGIVVTQTGYLMLVKSFTDDISWQVQRDLVNTYFRVGQLEEVVIEQHKQILNQNQEIENKDRELAMCKTIISAVEKSVEKIIDRKIEELRPYLNLEGNNTDKTIKRYVATSTYVPQDMRIRYDEYKPTDVYIPRDDDGAESILDFIKYGADRGVKIMKDEEMKQREIKNQELKSVENEEPKAEQKAISKSVIKFDVDDAYEEILKSVAMLCDDDTQRYIRTAKKIYSLIATERGWKLAMTRNHCANKKALIEKSPQYKKLFVVACNQIANGEVNI